MRSVSVWSVLCVALVGCSKKPPANFAPDPGLVGQLRQVRIQTPPRACPGQVIPASYTAVHESGLHLPFERRYDRNRPPKLHVSFLNRTSPDAVSQGDGDWSTYPDPLRTAMTGFRLTAFLRANPAVNGAATVEPEYSCLQHAWGFEGESGPEGGAGAGGPDVTVRVGYLRSPFYERLLVAAIEVGAAEPLYVFADGEAIPPADWLIVESRGGRGGRGVSGARGAAGTNGAPGCPGAPGSAGGPGGPGGPGGSGGRGGRITIIVPAEEPLLAGLVDWRSEGGRGGAGGAGGQGGAGGKGGAPQGAPAQVCQAGANGSDGARGAGGREGPDGPPGPRAQIVPVSRAELWGVRARPELRQLVDYSNDRP